MTTQPEVNETLYVDGDGCWAVLTTRDGLVPPPMIALHHPMASTHTLTYKGATWAHAALLAQLQADDEKRRMDPQ